MKLSIERKTLLEMLKTVKPAVVNKSAMACLTNILLEAKNGLLTVSATNLDMIIKTHSEVKIDAVSQEGSVTIAFEDFFKFISKIPDETIRIEEKDLTVKIESTETNGVKLKVQGMSRDDFPNIDMKGKWKPVRIASEFMREALSKVSDFRETGNIQSYLQCIDITIKDNIAYFTGTNGHKMAICSQEINKTEDTRFVLQKDVLPILSKLDYKLMWYSVDGNDKKALLVKTYNTEIWMRGLENSNMPFTETMNNAIKKSKHKLTVRKQEFIQTIETVSMFAPEVSNLIKLDIDTNNVNILATSEKGEIEKRVPALCSHDGESFLMGFNAQYLLSILKHIETEDVEIAFSDPELAIVLTDIPKGKTTYLCMPIKLI